MLAIPAANVVLIPAGRRNRRIVFERPTRTTNAHGQEVEGEPEVLAEVWAEVRFGTGDERRQAAQEAGSQAATFVCLWFPALAAVTLKERIAFDGSHWDILNIVPMGLNREIHFTGVRGR